MDEIGITFSDGAVAGSYTVQSDEETGDAVLLLRGVAGPLARDSLFFA